MKEVTCGGSVKAVGGWRCFEPLKYRMARRILEGYTTRVEVPYSKDLLIYRLTLEITEAFRTMKKQVPFGFWVMDYRVIEVLPNTKDVDENGYCKCFGVRCEMDIYTVKPWAWVMRKMGRVC